MLVLLKDYNKRIVKEIDNKNYIRLRKDQYDIEKAANKVPIKDCENIVYYDDKVEFAPCVKEGRVMIYDRKTKSLKETELIIDKAGALLVRTKDYGYYYKIYALSDEKIKVYVLQNELKEELELTIEGIKIKDVEFIYTPYFDDTYEALYVDGFIVILYLKEGKIKREGLIKTKGKLSEIRDDKIVIENEEKLEIPRDSLYISLRLTS